ncbi:siderophore ABC transporter substrate-binding protein [Staphylococcus edaphicus]|uniref:ABC transporter substrate-binding protein n=1 Tax=Staphylococcus edaphicus TaxID=1955013 RepID=A0A2C6WMP4_9STAP|nr:ABC transporter substrate-binding protein [Staphylococcus edaphicus]PHK49355.1 transferrin-binding protein [Staphylococcus edaphicus]UQW80482.1 ABC transporter substrate-binding protein [Staphylococcus edaphicus]
MKTKLVIFLTLCCIVVLTACNKESNQTKSQQDTVKIKNTYEFKEKNKDHKNGEIINETLEVPTNPKRVVVMDYGALDVMKALKLQKNIVAIAKGQGNSFLPNSLKEFKDKKYRNIGNPGQPNFNNLAKAKPDIIFASFRQARSKTLAEMKKAAPNAKIIFVSPQNDNYIDSIKQNTMKIGKIFKKETEVKALNRSLDKKITATRKVIDNSTVLFLNVDDKGIKTFGPTGRFGGFLNKDLGIKHADKNMQANSSGILISNEYLNKINPDKLFVVDRTKQASSQSKALPPSLDNDVIKNVEAIKQHHVSVFEANSWYFGEGGIGLTIDQLDQIQKAYRAK